jgi:membrane-associated phospholipid phosphatase
MRGASHGSCTCLGVLIEFLKAVRTLNFPDLFYPKMELLLMFCASSVALSGNVLVLHFLSDVLAGPAIGVMVGYLYRRCYRSGWSDNASCSVTRSSRPTILVM